MTFLLRDSMYYVFLFFFFFKLTTLYSYIITEPYGEVPSLLNHGLRKILVVFRDITLAMKHATDNGIFHRDIKPTNIIVHGNNGYLINWGIATINSLVNNDTISATLGFASMDVLDSVRSAIPFPYSVKDEIESIFYTLVYILCDGRVRWKVTGSITELFTLECSQ